MKKCLQLLLMLCILVLGAQSAFAGGLLGGTGVSEDRVYDQDGMLKIKTLAIAAPIYNGPKTEGEPEVEDLPEILMEGTLADKKGVLNYISYRDVCQNIKVAKHIDILRLDRKKAFAEYKEAIGKYADAYVVVTVSNGTSANVCSNCTSNHMLWNTGSVVFPQMATIFYIFLQNKCIKVRICSCVGHIKINTVGFCN